nr:hypothetical protein [Saprospiraceae bacterium]
LAPICAILPGAYTILFSEVHAQLKSDSRKSKVESQKSKAKLSTELIRRGLFIVTPFRSFYQFTPLLRIPVNISLS